MKCLFLHYMSKRGLFQFSTNLIDYAKNVNKLSNWLMIFCVLRFWRCLAIPLKIRRDGMSNLWQIRLFMPITVSHDVEKKILMREILYLDYKMYIIQGLHLIKN